MQQEKTPPPPVIPDSSTMEVRITGPAGGTGGPWLKALGADSESSSSSSSTSSPSPSPSRSASPVAAATMTSMYGSGESTLPLPLFRLSLSLSLSLWLLSFALVRPQLSALATVCPQPSALNCLPSTVCPQLTYKHVRASPRTAPAPAAPA